MTSQITRDEFLTAVGVVNAEIAQRGKTIVRFETRYREVAERIESMARGAGASSHRDTYMDDGWRVRYVITIRGLKAGRS